MRAFSPALLLLPLTLGTQGLSAQVGHAPGSSPYRDIPKSRALTLFFGDVGGDGGRIGVGPHQGQSYGGRLDLKLGTPLAFTLGVTHADLERFVVSAADSVATRRKGPVAQSLLLIEAGLQLNLTGRKTWHGLAPYLGGAFGWVRSSSLPASAPQDSSGYKFGSRISLTPAVGLRVYVTRSLHLQVEARQIFWKLRYPLAYSLEPAAQPSTDPTQPNAVIPDGKLNQWSGARELRAGLGYAF